VGSNWYFVFLISDPVYGNCLIFSSGLYPCVPQNTYYGRVGAVYTQSASPYYPLGSIQYNDEQQWVVKAGTNLTALRPVASGAGAFPTSIAWAPFAPPTASHIKFQATNAGTNTITGISGNNMWYPSSWEFAAPIIDVIIEDPLHVFYYGESAYSAVTAVGYKDNL
jgi:hypothetical protein